jgi:outer membrane autotransporter protein
MLDYSYMSLDGYTESDADALNLIVKPSSYSHLRPGVGLSASSLLDLSGVRIMPQVYGKYYRECLAPVIKTSSAFSGTSTYFDTKGAKVARDTFETGISLDLLLPKEMSLKFNYDAELRQSYTSNVLSAQFKGKF